MITVKQYTTSCDWMLYLDSVVLIGPIKTNGSEEYQEYSIRHHRDHLYEGPSLFGENTVSHYEVNGDIISFPDDVNIHPYQQSSDVPRRIQVDTRTRTGTKSVKTIGYGLFHFGEAFVVSTTSFYTQMYVERIGTAIHCYHVAGYLTEQNRVKSYRHSVVDNISITNESTYTCSKSAKNYSTSGGMLVDSGPWNAPRSGADIKALESQLSKWSASSLNPAVEFFHLYQDGNPSIAAAYEQIDLRIVSFERTPVNFEFTSYGDLAAEAAQAYIGTDLNMIEFLSDLRHPTELIPKLDNFKKVLRDKDKLLKMKRVSGEYLRVQYGILPTVRDVRKIWSSYRRNRPYFDKNGFQTVHAGVSQGITWLGVPVDITRRLKLAIMNNASEFSNSLDAFDRIGLLPSFDRLWDLVPYSFVVDWLLPVGSALEVHTAKKRIERYNIKYVTMSHKEVATLEFGSTSLSSFYGSIQLVQYHRWTSDQCPVPTLSLQFSTTGSSHWLEASSLILQRR